MGCISTKSVPSINNHSEPKHIKYLSLGKPNDVFWGIGIENETYLQFAKKKIHKGSFIKNNFSRERYSVAYFNDYRAGFVGDCIKKITHNMDYEIPIYLNSHSFTNTDKNNQPKKMYTKQCEPNQKFSGKTLQEYIEEIDEEYKRDYSKTFIFDGDSIEFTTLNFYKTNVNDCVDQLKLYKRKFLEKINNIFEEHKIFENYGRVIFPEINNGFVSFMTNLNNISICNNSTYHINITLPTLLDQKGFIKDKKNFIDIHMNAARSVQWIEPFLVACYSSPDIFSVLSDKFSRGSQRLSFSRYISVCSYNTESKNTLIGKKLNDLHSSNVKWYQSLTKNSPYISLETIGYDINFNKFENHGLEFRFFDWFPEEYLEDVINILVLCMDYSSINIIKNPVNNDIWNDVCKNCIFLGTEFKLSAGVENYFLENYIPHYKKTFEYKQNVVSFLQEIVNILYKNRTDISQKLSPNMKCPIINDYNRKVFKEYKKCLNI
jgi:hypothetical protein